ncbi:hypothetical protein T484DRAFT_2026231, partial [Baffinella frigidus]
MSNPNSNVPPGTSFPGLPSVNSSPAANVTGFSMPTTFPFAGSAVPSAWTPSSDDTHAASLHGWPLLAAQMAQPSNAAALQTLYATLANANSWNAGAMGVGTGDRRMLASLPCPGVQPVSTWPATHSGSPKQPAPQHQLNTFQLPPVPIAFSAQAPPPGGLLFHHGGSFHNNLGLNFGAGNFVPHGGGMHVPGAHAPNTAEGGYAAAQDLSAKPEDFAASVVPRRRGKERRVVLTLEFLTPYFDQPLEAVSERLGLSRSTIKAACRRLGLPQWPYAHTGPRKRRFSAPKREAASDASPSPSRGDDHRQEPFERERGGVDSRGDSEHRQEPGDRHERERGGLP